MCAQKKYSICRVWFSGFRHLLGLLEHIPVEKGAGNDCTDATKASHPGFSGPPLCNGSLPEIGSHIHIVSWSRSPLCWIHLPASTGGISSYAWVTLHFHCDDLSQLLVTLGLALLDAGPWHSLEIDSEGKCQEVREDGEAAWPLLCRNLRFRCEFLTRQNQYLTFATLNCKNAMLYSLTVVSPAPWLVNKL